MTAPRHDEEGHRREANRAVGVSAIGLAVTGALELVLAVFTGSVALLGDALHNLSDVSTSAVVFLGFRISKRGPTAAYPYGYERAEDLAGLGVALVIWLSAAFAGFESYLKFVRNGATDHLAIGMGGAALGIVGNQAVARYKAHVARRIQSATLEADARHSWLDALSSLGALIGLAIVATGRRWGDPIAGSDPRRPSGDAQNLPGHGVPDGRSGCLHLNRRERRWHQPGAFHLDHERSKQPSSTRCPRCGGSTGSCGPAGHVQA